MRRREHPMLPAHSHFHTCESIGESSDDPLVGKDDHVYCLSSMCCKRSSATYAPQSICENRIWSGNDYLQNNADGHW